MSNSLTKMLVVAARQRQSSGVIPGKRKRSTREKSVETDLNLKGSNFSQVRTLDFRFRSSKESCASKRYRQINAFNPPSYVKGYLRQNQICNMLEGNVLLLNGSILAFLLI